MIRWLALVLALGGWLCHSDAENPCPGATTCGLAVGDRCCPLGSVQVCNDFCSPDPVCDVDDYACADEATVLACPFAATIASASCGYVGLDDDGEPLFGVDATGTLSGCGQELVYFAVGDQISPYLPDCGTWMQGTFGGCVPVDDAPSTTTFELHAITHYQGTDKLTVGAGHGDALATALVDCP